MGRRELQRAIADRALWSDAALCGRRLLHSYEGTDCASLQAVFDLTIQEELGGSCRDRRPRVQRRKEMTDSAKPFAAKKFWEIKGRRMAYIDEGGKGAPPLFLLEKNRVLLFFV